MNDLFDEDYLRGLARKAAPLDGAVMIVSVDQAGVTTAGSAGTDAAGDAPVASDAFRVGSITKVFTSIATLTLVDQGLVDLDAAARDYVSRVPVDPDVTVRDLLRHTTGIYNYTDLFLEDFQALIADQDQAEQGRINTPEETVDLIADRDPLFEPGSRFSYSNTNYIILGVLIEEVSGQSYHEFVRDRILDPLALSSTYLAGFEEGPAPFDPFTAEAGVDYDYTWIATSAWAAGAMVSNANDLHTLFTALFDAQIVSETLLAQMTADKSYGLGVQLSEWPSGLIGHDGSVPGYITSLRHSTSSDVTAFIVSTEGWVDDTAERASARFTVVDGVFGTLASDADGE